MFRETYIFWVLISVPLNSKYRYLLLTIGKNATGTSKYFSNNAESGLKNKRMC
jgi:hypothetical protein